MTDQPSVTLQLEALNLVPGPLLEVHPEILVRCNEQELNVFITTGAVLDGDADDQTHVRIRWGDGAPEDEVWSRSADYEAAFAPNPWAFLERLLVTPNVRFEFQPFDAAPRVARFNARGLNRHIAAVKAACPARADTLSGHDSAGGRDTVVSLDVGLEQPNLVYAPKLEYQRLLKNAGIEGTVVVQFIVDTSGRVEPNSVQIVQSSNPGFEMSARAYIVQALFQPPRLYGRAVRARRQLPVIFTLTGP
jgi:protein TonB